MSLATITQTTGLNSKIVHPCKYSKEFSVKKIHYGPTLNYLTVETCFFNNGGLVQTLKNGHAKHVDIVR